MKKLFGTDGFRGIANEELTTIEALKIGYAIAKAFDQTSKPILIARDTRISGEMLEYAIASGISSAGKDVILCGVVPTPALAMLSKLKGEVGIMISASHNPPEYNGIKVVYKGQKLPDEVEEKIEGIYFNGGYNSEPWSIGKIRRDENLKEEYIKYVLNSVANDIDIKGLRVLVDLANGAATSTVPEVLESLGAKVDKISDEQDGMKINVECGSTNPEYLLSRFTERHDIAASFDGDADRCIMANDKSTILDGDFIMAMNALYMKKSGILRNNTLVATIMSNYGMEKFLSERNVKVVRTKVGDRYVLEKMLEGNYNLGGEQSGHIIFLDYSPTGDGLITFLRALKIFTDEQEIFNEVLQNLEKMPQFLENVHVKDKEKVMRNPELLEKINDVQKRLKGIGRVVVRPSGTEKLIRIMVECENKELAKWVIKHLKEAILNFEK